MIDEVRCAPTPGPTMAAPPTRPGVAAVTCSAGDLPPFILAGYKQDRTAQHRAGPIARTRGWWT